MEGECYDYDADVDELFVLATKIISPVSIGQDEVYMTCVLSLFLCQFNYF